MNYVNDCTLCVCVHSKQVPVSHNAVTSSTHVVQSRVFVELSKEDDKVALVKKLNFISLKGGNKQLA